MIKLFFVACNFANKDKISKGIVKNDNIIINNEKYLVFNLQKRVFERGNKIISLDENKKEANDKLIDYLEKNKKKLEKELEIINTNLKMLKEDECNE